MAMAPAGDTSTSELTAASKDNSNSNNGRDGIAGFAGLRDYKSNRLGSPGLLD